MAKPRNTKIMIYVAHSEPKARQPQTGSARDECLTGPGAQLKSCMDQNPTVYAGNRKRSLVFGASVVRMGRFDSHLCAAGEAAVRHVNRLWYGRALVALRTYPQWTLRAAALNAHLSGILEDGGANLITFGNPVQ